MNYKSLGDNIRKYRKLKGYTLEELAELLDVSTTFIGQIERAKGIPSLETFVKIANTLGVSTDCLLFGDLNEKAGDIHFIGEISELTQDFNSKGKELLLKNIQTICEIIKTRSDM